jgi:Zn finger protein HypA/HybF involved in hydrogenase expression
MKKSILIAILAVALAFTFSACNNSTPADSKVEVKSAEKAEYTCTMHPEVQSDKPGDCPKCRMALVKVEPADTTMHNKADTMHVK